MALSDEFVDYIVDQFSAWGSISVRKMFGGAGLYRNGMMFGLIADDVAYLKVDDSNRSLYEEAGSGPFQPYPDKPTTMSYYEIPPDILEDPVSLGQWADRSLAIQSDRKNKEAREDR